MTKIQPRDLDDALVNTSVLVTGSQGLLGLTLCNLLSRLKYDVIGTVRKKTRQYNFRTIELDFDSRWDISKIPKNVDIIIHLAQSRKFREFPESAADIFNVNVNSTRKLLEYAAAKPGFKQFIFTSSGGIYADSSLQNEFIEDGEIKKFDKLGFYLGSKVCGEVLVQSYQKIFRTTILRPFFIYGPNQNRSMLIPRLFDNVLNNIPIKLSGPQGISINPIHVEDATMAIKNCIEKENDGIYNLAGPEILSLREICEQFAQYSKTTPTFHYDQNDQPSIIGDIKRLERDIYRPEILLRDRVRDIEST